MEILQTWALFKLAAKRVQQATNFNAELVLFDDESGYMTYGQGELESTHWDNFAGAIEALEYFLEHYKGVSNG